MNTGISQTLDVSSFGAIIEQDVWLDITGMRRIADDLQQSLAISLGQSVVFHDLQLTFAFPVPSALTDFMTQESEVLKCLLAPVWPI